MTSRPWWHDGIDDWTLITDWWKQPALAYLAGLAHGVQLERDRQGAVDDQVHREAVKRALDFVARCEARTVAMRKVPTPVPPGGVRPW